MAEAPAWERIQIKTFTKWCNTHLKKSYGANAMIEKILEDWENGVPLMRLAVALYKENDKNPEQAISMPKLKEKEMAPAMRINKVNNCTRAIGLLKTAGVNIRGVSAENLVDHDKVQILGMVWIIILDYAARGFGGSSAEVKRALLEWVNKKTNGYERVNPPGVKNFTKDWRSGLAWCALIHAHRPDLINYDECLGKSNAENLETAFSVAENDLDIPRLLDVEDVDIDTPDDKSIMTYVMEYFHRFASEGLKESAAQQAADWLKFMRDLLERQNDYERRARLLLGFCGEKKDEWANYEFGETLVLAGASFDKLRNFVTEEKPKQEAEKMDLEALYAEIQTILKVNNLKPYVPPADIVPDALQTEFMAMVEQQAAHGIAVRENRFKYIEKKDDSSSQEIEDHIEATFRKYDNDNSDSLNKIEFEAALMEMNIVLRNQDEKDKLFQSVAGDDDRITHDEYSVWMKSRLIVSLDDPEGIKSAFKAIAGDARGLTEAQLGTKPLTDDDVEYLKANMPKHDDGTYDYATFVDSVMGAERMSVCLSP